MANDFPRCPEEVCTSLPASLAQQCKDSGFPPNHPVAVVLDETTICQCSCGQAAGPERESALVGKDAELQGVPDCPWMECEFDPIAIKACQGMPEGTPVVLHSKTPEQCRCACWGGPLAPCKIQNGEGQFVALDELPAGSFVAACGLDLEWFNVLLRYATRPRQVAPQDGIRLVTAEADMVVPRTHIFVTLQYRLIPAHKLREEIVLLAPDGKGVPIVEIEEVETKSTYQFVATSEETPLEDLRYHLLNSQGVVSGDYAVQRAYEERALPKSRLAYRYPDNDED